MAGLYWSGATLKSFVLGRRLSDFSRKPLPDDTSRMSEDGGRGRKAHALLSAASKSECRGVSREACFYEARVEGQPFEGNNRFVTWEEL